MISGACGKGRRIVAEHTYTRSDGTPTPDSEYDPATAEIDMEADANTVESGPFEPSVANIDAALRRAHEAEAEASFDFVPAGRGAPLPSRGGSYPRPGDPNYNDPRYLPEPGDDGPDLSGLRAKIDETLPVVALLMRWHRMYNDRQQRAALDRQLDAIGYPPLRYNRDRTRVETPEERQVIYTALAGPS